MEIKMTDAAVTAALNFFKKELAEQEDTDEKYVGVRIAVKGGGCGGFEYAMHFEVQSSFDANRDLEFEFGENEKLKVFVDKFSMQYIDGTEIDYVDDSLQGSGFKFNNPNIKTTCGCGSSFSA